MPLRTAYALCPSAVFLPVDGAKYVAVSGEVMTILRRFTPLVEPISIDEAFLDVTGVRGAVRGRRGDRAADQGPMSRPSSGSRSRSGWPERSSSRRSPATCASPTAWSSSRPARRRRSSRRSPITRLWGVGERTAQALREFGVPTIGDLAALDPDLLGRRFGKVGRGARRARRGIDDDPVEDREPAKSIGHEHTFDVDTSDRRSSSGRCWRWPRGSRGGCAPRGCRPGRSRVKIRDTAFRTITRQRTLRRTDRPHGADLADGAGPRPQGDPRHARCASWASPPRTSTGPTSWRCSAGRRGIRQLAPATRRPGRRTRSGGASATGRSLGLDSWVRGCRRRSSATR